MIKLFIFAMVFLPQVAIAQITVRTGDHETFSRIVLTIPVDTEWRITPTENGAKIGLGGEQNIIIDGFYDKIQKDRIAEVTVLNRDIVLNFGCSCSVEAFLWQPRKIVIDVLDLQISDISKAEINVIEIPKLPSLLPVIFENKNNDGLYGYSNIDTIDFHLKNAEIQLPKISGISNEATEKIEIEVLESISQAASQGIIRLSNDLDVNDLHPSEHRENQRTDLLSSNDDAPGMRLRLSRDHDFPLITSEAVEDKLQSCPSDSQYDVVSWGSENLSFSSQISEKRRALYADPDSFAVEGLAKAYIYFGFGREALNSFEAYNTLDQDRMALITLAQIIDDENVRFPIPSHFIECTNKVAFWAFLSNDTSGNLNRNEVLQQFRELPSSLQFHLGPRVSQQFLKYSDFEAAELVLQRNLTSPDVTIDTKFANISLAVQQEKNKPEDISVKFSNISNTEVHLSAERLLSLLEYNNSNKIKTPIGLIELSEIMRFENRNDEIADSLGIQEVKSFILAKEFDAAILTYEELSLPSEDSVDLYREISYAVTLDADDIYFLNFIFMKFYEIDDADIENLIAKRLLDLGFANKAEVYINDGATGSAMMERRYLRAEAALMLEDYNRIEATLVGVSTKRSELLRDASLARQNGYEVPIKGFDSEISTDQRESAAWRNGNWQELIQSNDSIIFQSSNLVLASANLGIDNNSLTLSEGYQLIENSENLFDFLQNLSKRYVVID